MGTAVRLQAPVSTARLAAGVLWGFAGDSITAGTGASNVAYSYPYLAAQNVGGLIAGRGLRRRARGVTGGASRGADETDPVGIALGADGEARKDALGRRCRDQREHPRDQRRIQLGQRTNPALKHLRVSREVRKS